MTRSPFLCPEPLTMVALPLPHSALQWRPVGGGADTRSSPAAAHVRPEPLHGAGAEPQSGAGAERLRLLRLPEPGQRLSPGGGASGRWAEPGGRSPSLQHTVPKDRDASQQLLSLAKLLIEVFMLQMKRMKL